MFKVGVTVPTKWNIKLVTWNLIWFVGTRTKTIKINDIVFIESNDIYVFVKLISVKLISVKSFVKRSTLSEMLKKLPENDFTKISRSIIVNHSYIKKIETDQVVFADIKFSNHYKSLPITSGLFLFKVSTKKHLKQLFNSLNFWNKKYIHYFRLKSLPIL